MVSSISLSFTKNVNSQNIISKTHGKKKKENLSEIFLIALNLKDSNIKTLAKT